MAKPRPSDGLPVQIKSLNLPHFYYPWLAVQMSKKGKAMAKGWAVRLAGPFPLGWWPLRVYLGLPIPASTQKVLHPRKPASPGVTRGEEARLLWLGLSRRVSWGGDMWPNTWTVKPCQPSGGRRKGKNTNCEVTEGGRNVADSRSTKKHEGGWAQRGREESAKEKAENGEKGKASECNPGEQNNLWTAWCNPIYLLKWNTWTETQRMDRERREW